MGSRKKVERRSEGERDEEWSLGGDGVNVHGGIYGSTKSGDGRGDRGLRGARLPSRRRRFVRRSVPRLLACTERIGARSRPHFPRGALAVVLT